MPILREFDTELVRPWYKPTADTCATLRFPRPFVAPPRLPHGLRRLAVGCNANIRVKSTLQDTTESRTDCHITTWRDTTLYVGAAHVFSLAPSDLDFLTGEHMRHRSDPSSVHVSFERTFVTPPKVVVFFNYIDLGKSHNWRLKTIATDIDVCWIAYPEDREHIFSASLNTMDLRPPDQPGLTQSRRVTFHDVEFWKDPAVFIALNYIDIDNKTNLRINSYVDDVSRTGLVLHIDSWDDTILYAAGVSLIAFN
ncbi:hypothetical protein J3R82DRAFT_10111 [Butyriboletus roseoflavus]|nr:hypothetical protein J3R82DRAFT_10111 [Butyriboletus roseoflavus]